MKRLTILFLCALALLSIAGGCKKKIAVTGDDKLPEGYVPVGSIELVAPKTTINVNEEVQFTATVSPEDASYPTVTWTSSNPEVASVSESGLVKGLMKGESTIKAEAGGKDRQVVITVVKPQPNGAVDLGCSVYWRNRNIGASKGSDAGEFYAWGETEPKSSYLRDNYRNWNGTDYKYKDLYNNDVAKDAAAQLPGGVWRMPTKAEVEELISKCTVRESTVNGKACYIVASKANPDIDIVLPKCGVSNSESTYYWCSTFGSDRPDALSLTKMGSTPTLNVSSYDGWSGLPIRPVADK